MKTLDRPGTKEEGTIISPRYRRKVVQREKPSCARVDLQTPKTVNSSLAARKEGETLQRVLRSVQFSTLGPFLNDEGGGGGPVTKKPRTF